MKKQTLSTIGALVVAAFLVAIPVVGTAQDAGALPQSKAESILGDTTLFPEGFHCAFREYSGRQVYPVPLWHRPRAVDVALRHGVPDLEVCNEIDGAVSRVVVYGNVAFGLEPDCGHDVVAWVATWNGVARTEGTRSPRDGCPPSYDGRWNGSSGVGPLSFTVANRALTRVQLNFNIRNGGCTASGSTVLTFSSPLPISGTSLFVSVPPVPSLGFTLRGTFDSNAAASGTLQFIFIPCGYDSTSAWTATNRTFGVCVQPTSAVIGKGESVNFPVEVLSIGGFGDAVALAANVLPSGASVTASLASNTVTPGSSTTLTVSTDSATPFGDYTVTVTGTSGADTRSRSTTVTVSPPDFALAVEPAALTVNRKQTGSLAVAVGRIAGFGGTVTVTAPDTKAIKVKLTPKSQATSGTSVTFDFKVKKKAALGTYDLVFSGRDAEGRVRTATVTMTVQ